MTNTVHVAFFQDAEKILSEDTEKKAAIYETHRLAGELAKTIPMILDMLREYFTEATKISEPLSGKEQERILDLDNRFHWVSDILQDKADDMAKAMRDADLSEHLLEMEQP